MFRLSARKLSSLFIILLVAAAAPAQQDDSQNQPAAQPAADVPLASPRATMQFFLEQTNDGDYEAAAETLDFSGLDADPSPAEKRNYAWKLKETIDRLAWVDIAEISDQVEGQPYSFPPDAENQPIVIGRQDDGTWRFTSGTVARIDELYEAYQAQPKIVTRPPWYRSHRYSIVGNAPWRVGALFIAILLGMVAGKVLQWILFTSSRTFEKRRRPLTATALRAIARGTTYFVTLVGLKIGLEFLVLNATVVEFAGTIISILFAIVIAYVAWCMVDVVVVWLREMAAKTESKLDDMLVPMVRSSLRVTVIVLVLVQIATILSDKPVTSIIAGLGIGGLAIGLAAQDTIKNFFGSIMLLSDRPFEVGDRIQIDGTDGPVESVGFRSTRIRTLEGHVVTIPNGELANKAIRNISERPNIRRIMNIGITYDTPREKIQRAVEIVREILDNHEGMDEGLPPKVYFNEFNDSSLNIFAIYWYHPPDWWPYNDFSEWVNYQIFERFAAEGIEFAFPTQTVYVAGDPNRPFPPPNEGQGQAEGMR